MHGTLKADATHAEIAKYALGLERMSICPHCGASTIIEPSPSLRFRCGVCGGPVVPVEGARAHEGAELANLVAAQRARAMAFGWTATALVLGAIAAMTTGLSLLLLWAQSRGPAVGLGVIAAIAVLLTVTAARSAHTRRADMRAKLEDAWEQAAEDLIATQGGRLTAPELALAMRTDAPHAESLLSRLSARGRTRVRVRDDAELVYAADAPTTQASDTQARAARGPRP